MPKVRRSMNQRKNDFPKAFAFLHVSSLILIQKAFEGVTMQNPGGFVVEVRLVSPCKFPGRFCGLPSPSELYRLFYVPFARSELNLHRSQ